MADRDLELLKDPTPALFSRGTGLVGISDSKKSSPVSLLE